MSVRPPTDWAAAIAVSGVNLLVRRSTAAENLYWSLVFDASDVGITQNVTVAEFLPNGTLLLALDRPQTVPGLGTVKSPRHHPVCARALWVERRNTRGIRVVSRRLRCRPFDDQAEQASMPSPCPAPIPIISIPGHQSEPRGWVPRAGGAGWRWPMRISSGWRGRSSARFRPGGAGRPIWNGSTVPGMAARMSAGRPCSGSTESAWRARGQPAADARGVRPRRRGGNARDVLLAWKGISPASLDIIWPRAG